MYGGSDIRSFLTDVEKYWIPLEVPDLIQPHVKMLFENFIATEMVQINGTTSDSMGRPTSLTLTLKFIPKNDKK